MRPLTKVLLAIIAICGLAQAILIGLLLWPNRFISRFVLQQYLWIRPTLLGLTAIVGLTFLVMLLVALFRRSTSHQLVIQSENGDLTLEKNAIENMVTKKVIAEHPVTQARANVAIRRHNNAQVRVEAVANQKVDLNQLSQAIETTTRSVLEQNLGINIKQVSVRLVPLEKARWNQARVV